MQDMEKQRADIALMDDKRYRVLQKRLQSTHEWKDMSLKQFRHDINTSNAPLIAGSMMYTLDPDGNGECSFSQITTFLESTPFGPFSYWLGDQIETGFAKYDLNKGGSLDTSELTIAVADFLKGLILALILVTTLTLPFLQGSSSESELHMLEHAKKIDQKAKAKEERRREKEENKQH